MLCLVHATPTHRNEVTPPPGQLGLGFQKTKCSHRCSPARAQGEQEKISHAHFSIRGPAQRPRVLDSPWSGAGKKEAEEVFEYQQGREQSCSEAAVILEQAS